MRTYTIEARLAINLAIEHDLSWTAINTRASIVGEADLFCFAKRDEAAVFAADNYSDEDSFEVVSTISIYKLQNRVPMNEKNFDYLQSQLKYTGFGEELSAKLKENMEKQAPEFALFHQKDFGKDHTVATLQFRKSDDSDMYFFNRYSLAVKNEHNPDPIKQTFYINQKEDNVTLKEAYNLMSGRAVHKEFTPKTGEKYQAWMQLDFKATDAHGNFAVRKFNENYGFDLLKSVGKYPFKELNDPEQRQALMESLQRGNRQSVTLDMHGNATKMYIEAAPQFKSINFYDSQLKRTHAPNLHPATQQKTEQTSKQSAKQDMKAADGGGDDIDAPPAQKKKRGQKIS